MIKKRFILNFPPDSGDKPLSYHLVKDYDIRINILKAEVFPGKRAACCSNCRERLPILKRV
jgi:L-aspartate semialdehyde sulfurtransferase ferredoxin